MKLIADSGATGTDWAYIDDKNQVLQFRTSGINVSYLSEGEINKIITTEVIPVLKEHKIQSIPKIYFYGAGCSTLPKQTIMQKILRLISPNAAIIADHDMLGAAISISQGDKMCVCILGTGSNSCIYDGKSIVKNILSLGYVLGDEGSGTYLGMKFIQNLLKGKTPKDLTEKFYAENQKTPSDIVYQMYQAPKMGAYFASYSHILRENNNHPYIDNLLKDCFRDFFREQVFQFEEVQDYPIGFIGSIAYVFEKQLRAVGRELNVNITTIIQNPIEGLISYYQHHE